MSLAVLAPGAGIPLQLQGLALIPPLVWLSHRDIRAYEIPDLATLTFAIIGAAFLVWQNPQALLLHLAAGAVISALLWGAGEIIYRLRGAEGLGIGDAKLLGAAVVVLGPWKLPELLLLSSAGGITATLAARVRRPGRQEGIPFGPFIAYAVFVLIYFNPLFL
ncbi:prepilin peptidase [Leisingera sp. ANG-M7]|uniref:prepilin peptidase n=1 Tax=Leisingera sp. ANG-M7 TaxID=1577902 RepID=UPI001F4C7AFB|nr:A24 family peptidase [Leisingera sp. ANG-M7]